MTSDVKIRAELDTDNPDHTTLHEVVAGMSELLDTLNGLDSGSLVAVLCRRTGGDTGICSHG